MQVYYYNILKFNVANFMAKEYQYALDLTKRLSSCTCFFMFIRGSRELSGVHWYERADGIHALLRFLKGDDGIVTPSRPPILSKMIFKHVAQRVASAVKAAEAQNSEKKNRVGNRSQLVKEEFSDRKVATQTKTKGRRGRPKKNDTKK